MNVAVSAQDIDLGALKPYAVLFASFPQQMGLNGIAQSQLKVTRENGVYHISTDATRIQNFTLTSPEKETFQQQQVTALFDVYIDPNAKTINVEQLQVESPQIRIRKGTLRQTTQGNTARLQGQLDAQWDWAAVGQAASAFMPGNAGHGRPEAGRDQLREHLSRRRSERAARESQRQDFARIRQRRVPGSELRPHAD